MGNVLISELVTITLLAEPWVSFQDILAPNCMSYLAVGCVWHYSLSVIYWIWTNIKECKNYTCWLIGVNSLFTENIHWKNQVGELFTSNLSDLVCVDLPRSTLYTSIMCRSTLCRSSLCRSDLVCIDLPYIDPVCADLLRSTLFRSNLCRSSLCRSTLYRSNPCRSTLYTSNLCRSTICRYSLCSSTQIYPVYIKSV